MPAQLLRTAVAALLLGLAAPLWAHEDEVRTIPQDGETVQDTPEEIGIRFDGAMQIAHFDVIGPQGSVRLEDEPGDEATEDYRVRPAEDLAPGDYRVQWRGLASDGHMMSGDFSFTITD